MMELFSRLLSLKTNDVVMFIILIYMATYWQGSVAKIEVIAIGK